MEGVSPGLPGTSPSHQKPAVCRLSGAAHVALACMRYMEQASQIQGFHGPCLDY